MKNVNNSKLVLVFASLSLVLSLAVIYLIFWENKVVMESLTELDKRYDRLQEKLESSKPNRN